MRQKRQVFAVLRIDDFHSPDTPADVKITVKEVVDSQEVAQREVERLTRLNQGKDCRYYWQATRFIGFSE